MPRETWSKVEDGELGGVVLARFERKWRKQLPAVVGPGIPGVLSLHHLLPSLSVSVGSTKEQTQVMASQLFRDVAQLLTPAPPVFDDDYDGLEFTWKFFVFRPGSEWWNHFISLSSSFPLRAPFLLTYPLYSYHVYTYTHAHT